MTEVEGDLASSWVASDDGREWTFKLVDGRKFADGTPVNAEAVKFSFERLLKVAKGPAETVGPVSEVQAIDDSTVKFVLKEPFGPFRSEEHTSELQSLMRISYAVFC